METKPQYSVIVKEYPSGREATLRLTQNGQIIAVLLKLDDDNDGPSIGLSDCLLSAEQFQAALAGLIELGGLNLKWSAE